MKNSFSWVSDEISFYFDNRISLSYPNIRKEITKRLVSIIKEKYDDVGIIAGVATAGIPQGALVAENLNHHLLMLSNLKVME